MVWWQSLLAVVATGCVGYVLGVAKSFREQKLNAYEEILPVFIRAAFDPAFDDQDLFNKSLIRLWLFANKSVALSMDHALACQLHPDKGDPLKALQAAIAEMRSDIQLLPWEKLDPGKVSHFYTRFVQAPDRPMPKAKKKTTKKATNKTKKP